MIMRQLRWLITLICMKVREKAEVIVTDESHRLEQTFTTDEKGACYKLTVKRVDYTINYKRLFLPLVERTVYEATVERIEEGLVVDTHSRTYPSLTFLETPVGVDQGYILSIIANHHLNTYIKESES